MDIDSIIAEATQPVANEQSAALEAASSDADNQAEVKAVETQEDIEKKPDSDLTPEQLAKREANRESHRKSSFAQMRREAREAKAEAQRLKAEIEAIRQGSQPKSEPKAEGEPKAEDYESWEDYSKALIRYEAKQIREAETKQTQEVQEQQKRQAWKAEREVQIAHKAIEVMKQIPDYKEMVEEYGDVLDSFDDTPIETAFLEAENPELAAYALMKEGKLESLAQMSPYKMAMEIAKAEVRGAAYLKQPKPVTSAPAPLSPAKGSAVGGKSIERMTPNELKEWLAS